MRRFIIQFFSFLAIAVFIDFTLGEVFAYCESHAAGGNTQREYYINKLANEDVLIFGSSRAMNHYHPQVLSDSLKKTVYNCGENETGIVCFYPKLNYIKKRYRPKMIICDIYYVDLLDHLRISNIDFLKTLKTSYGETDAVDSMFCRYESYEKYKMLSRLYRHNSTFLSTLIDNVRHTHWYENGFYLMNTSQMDYEPKVDNSHKEYVYDYEKLRLLEQFIQENRDSVQLCFAISPEYGKTNDEMYLPIKEMCNRYNIPLLNHYCDTAFTKHRDLFSNQNHLNQQGARLYSSVIAAEISSYQTNM